MHSVNEHGYVHGYTEYESGRLSDSANALAELNHAATRYRGGHVLEAGCGVGAQTRLLLQRCPGTRLTSFDMSLPSLRRALAGVPAQARRRARFVNADLFHVPFRPRTFDHVFICYVLEHLADPLRALHTLAPLAKPAGTITAIEGDHGSAFFHPCTPEAWEAWLCLTEVQRRLGGDALIGRRLHGLFHAAGLEHVSVEPIVVYCDPSRPVLMDGFVDKTIVGMLRGIEAQVLGMGLMKTGDWRKGLADLLDIVHHPEGSFTYIFFRAVGTLPGQAEAPADAYKKEG